MKIIDIREVSVPLRSSMRNAVFDFSEMTTSVVAVITDVQRAGRPVVGYAFNSTGRYACGAVMRARMEPSLMAALLAAHGEKTNTQQKSRQSQSAGVSW